MHSRVVAGLLLAVSAQAAQFLTGQAARAVLGQSSFSSHDAGISGTALTVSKGKLYVAETSGKLLTFDLSQIPAADAELSAAGATCKLCGFAPVASISQAVAPGTATISGWGKTLAAIDARGRRVLIWRDITARSAFVKPDVILHFGQGGLFEPISVALDGQRLFVGDASLRAVLVWNAFPEQDNQAADAILGGSNPDAPPTAGSIQRPEALASDGTNLFVADPPAHRILLFSPGDTRLYPEAVINAATLQTGSFAGGTLISVSASSISEETAAANEDGSEALPVSLGGIELVFNGAPLPLISVSPQELRGQLPYTPTEMTAGNLYIRVRHPGGNVTVSNAVALTLAPSSPGLFAFAGEEPRPGIAFHEEAPVSKETPAAPGEVVKLWVTGLRVNGESRPVAGMPLTNAISLGPVMVNVNGEPAEVVKVSLPSTSIGVYEVLFRLPDLPYSNGMARVTLGQDGVSSNTVVLSVAR